MLSKSQVEASIRSASRKGNDSGTMARFRFITIIPLVTSAIAFVLHLILLNAGSDVTRGPGDYLLTIDTSHVFERIIVVKNTNNATAIGQNNGTNSGNNGGENNGGSTGTPTGIIPTGIIPTGLIPTGLIPTGLIPTGNPAGTPTGTTTSAPASTTTGGFLDGIGSLVPDIIPGIFNKSGSDSGSDASNSGGGLLGGLGNLLPNLTETATSNDATGADVTGVRKFFNGLRNGIDQFFDGLVKNLENRFKDSLTELAPGIDKFITGLIGGLTAEVNNQIQQFILDGVQKGREVAGIKDRYDVYYSNICSGNLVNREDPNSVKYTTCGGIRDLTKPSNEAPKERTSFFVIGTTNITFPFLEPGAVDLRTATSALDFVATLSQVTLYTSLVTSVINFLLAPVAFFLPDSRNLVLANIIFSSLTPGPLFTGALASTLVNAVLRDLAADVGKAVSVEASLGAAALVMLWFSWFLSLATATFWDLYWFVYIRREVWVKMKKPEDEIGSWKKSFAGARRRMKVREDPTDEEKRAAGETDSGELRSWKKSFAEARRRTKLKEEGTADEETSSQRRLNVRGSSEEEERGRGRVKTGDGVASIGNYRLSPIRVGGPTSSIKSPIPIHPARFLP
ncbi:sur7 protein [Apiospora arundinis]|uniref:Sur7 protein n=1 Tax=Apiospora arundinis TaxID=335852 RepID=A0ABR2JJ49_9PEZI